MKKRYLGDSVYAELERGIVKLIGERNTERASAQHYHKLWERQSTLAEEQADTIMELKTQLSNTSKALVEVCQERDALSDRAFDECCPEWFRFHLHGLADQAAKRHWLNVVFRIVNKVLPEASRAHAVRSARAEDKRR